MDLLNRLKKLEDKANAGSAPDALADFQDHISGNQILFVLPKDEAIYNRFKAIEKTIDLESYNIISIVINDTLQEG